MTIAPPSGVLKWASILICVLSLLCASPALAADELTLHFVPSPKGINWSRPKTLAYSTLWNQVAKVDGGARSSIGHVYVEMNCGGTHFFTGATDIGNAQEKKALFRDGYGFGVLLKTYVGVLNDSDEAERNLSAMHATGRSNFLRFLVSPRTCSRLLQYFQEYKSRGYSRVYAGLNARPRRGEGSGCSAFGASFLEMAGVLAPEFERRFTRTLILPRKFVGGAFTRKRVSLSKILLAFSAKWDRDLSKGGFLVHFYDPERMHDWVAGAVDSLQANPDRTFPWRGWVSYLGRSEGITFDATQVATPTDPIFSVPPPRG